MRGLLLSLLVLVTLLNASEENPTKEEVAKLYVATFNRAPDAGGLAYWTNDSFGGKPTLSGIASSFFDQPETQDTYPDGTSYRDFIQSIYANLFNREPDTSGWDYWEAELESKRVPKNKFIIAVINGALDNEDGLDKSNLTNKMRVGLSFSEAGFNNKDDAKNIMADVNSNRNSIVAAVNKYHVSLYGNAGCSQLLSYAINPMTKECTEFPTPCDIYEGWEVCEPNKAPAANAGLDQVVDIDTIVTLDGSLSVDANNDDLTYTWSITSLPNDSNATLSSTSGENPTFIADINGIYAISLIVSDSKIDSEADSVEISAEIPNVGPIANAGVDQIVLAATTVTLDGSLSSDSDGEIESYKWKEGGITLSTAATFTKADFSVGVHTITLTVTDNDSETHSDSVIITVNEKDEDEDGYTISQDCNDLNAFVNPNVQELLDNIDNNCNGDIDEGFTFSWSIGEWESCIQECTTNIAIQTRAVACISSIDTIVDDSKCTESKPDITQTCTTTVNCNPAPEVQDSTIKTLQDTVTNGVFQSIDVNDNYLEHIIVSEPEHGTLELIENTTTFKYTPESGYVGNDNFTYKAYDGQKYSNEATVTIIVEELPAVNTNDTTPPEATTIVSINSQTETITLFWLAASDNNSSVNDMRYEVHLSTDANFTTSSSSLQQTLVDTLEADVGNLSPDTLYYVKVKALDEAGNSSESDEASVKTTLVEAVINPQVQVRKATTLRLEGAEQEANKLTFTDSSKAELPESGDILIGTPEDGYLKKVVSTSRVGDTTEVVTEDVTITELVDTATISSKTVLFGTADDSVDSRSMKRSVRYRSNNIKETTTSWSSGRLSMTDTQKLAPKISPRVLTKGNTNFSVKIAQDNVIIPKNKTIEIDIEATMKQAGIDDAIEFQKIELVSFTHPDKFNSNKFGAWLTTTKLKRNEASAYIKWTPKQNHVSAKPYTAVFRVYAVDRECNTWNDFCDEPEETLEAKITVIGDGKVDTGGELQSSFNSSTEFTNDVTFDFTPSLTVEHEISGSTVESALIAVNGKVNFDVLTKFAYKAYATKKYNRELFNKSYRSVYMAGAVPVYQEIKFTLNAELIGTADTSISATSDLKTSFEVSAGMKYDGVDWSPVASKKLEKDYTVTVEAAGGVHVHVRLIPNMEISFYEIATAGISVEPWLDGDIRASATAIANTDFHTVDTLGIHGIDNLTLDVGVEGKVYANLRVWKFNLARYPSEDNDENGDGKKTVFNPSENVFSIPTITLTDNEIDVCSQDPYILKANIENPKSLVSNDFDLSSANWLVFPSDGATITTNKTQATFEFTKRDSYDVYFIGNSQKLGNVFGKQYKSFSVDTRDCEYTGENEDNNTTEDDLPLRLYGAPRANANGNKLTFEGKSVYLDGSRSRDEDGHIVQYAWYVNNTLIKQNEREFYHTFSIGEHDVKLVVTDNEGKTDEDLITVTILEEIELNIDHESTPQALGDAKAYYDYLVATHPAGYVIEVKNLYGTTVITGENFSRFSTINDNNVHNGPASDSSYYGYYINGKKEGWWKSYTLNIKLFYEDGQELVGQYYNSDGRVRYQVSKNISGEYDGEQIHEYSDIHRHTNYINGVLDGVRTVSSSNGDLIINSLYENGDLKSFEFSGINLRSNKKYLTNEEETIWRNILSSMEEVYGYHNALSNLNDAEKVTVSLRNGEIYGTIKMNIPYYKRTLEISYENERPVSFVEYNSNNPAIKYKEVTFTYLGTDTDGMNQYSKLKTDYNIFGQKRSVTKDSELLELYDYYDYYDYYDIYQNGLPVLESFVSRSNSLVNRTDYYENGNVMVTAHWQDNGNILGTFGSYSGPNNPVAEGKWQRFFDDGSLKWEVSYLNGFKEGVETNYNSNTRKLISEISYSQGIKNGMAKYYDDGALISEVNYTQGSINGVLKRYYKSGTLQESTNYLNDLRHGSSITYYESGTVEYEIVYDNGQQISVEFYCDTGHYLDLTSGNTNVCIAETDCSYDVSRKLENNTCVDKTCEDDAYNCPVCKDHEMLNYYGDGSGYCVDICSVDENFVSGTCVAKTCRDDGYNCPSCSIWEKLTYDDVSGDGICADRTCKNDGYNCPSCSIWEKLTYDDVSGDGMCIDKTCRDDAYDCPSCELDQTLVHDSDGAGSCQNICASDEKYVNNQCEAKTCEEDNYACPYCQESELLKYNADSSGYCEDKCSSGYVYLDGKCVESVANGVVLNLSEIPELQDGNDYFFYSLIVDSKDNVWIGLHNWLFGIPHSFIVKYSIINRSITILRTEANQDFDNPADFCEDVNGILHFTTNNWKYGTINIDTHEVLYYNYYNSLSSLVDSPLGGTCDQTNGWDSDTDSWGNTWSLDSSVMGNLLIKN